MEKWELKAGEGGYHRISDSNSQIVTTTFPPKAEKEIFGRVPNSEASTWWIVDDVSEKHGQDTYVIRATSRTSLCWSLTSGEDETPVYLQEFKQATQNVWKIVRVPESHTTDQSYTRTLDAGTESSVSKPAPQGRGPRHHAHRGLEDNRADDFTSSPTPGSPMDSRPGTPRRSTTDPTPSAGFDSRRPPGTEVSAYCEPIVQQRPMWSSSNESNCALETQRRSPSLTGKGNTSFSAPVMSKDSDDYSRDVRRDGPELTRGMSYPAPARSSFNARKTAKGKFADDTQSPDDRYVAQKTTSWPHPSDRSPNQPSQTSNFSTVPQRGMNIALESKNPNSNLGRTAQWGEPAPELVDAGDVPLTSLPDHTAIGRHNSTNIPSHSYEYDSSPRMHPSSTTLPRPAMPSSGARYPARGSSQPDDPTISHAGFRTFANHANFAQLGR
ncbi:hypothetical protein POSPLADRAFT_1061997 [Postia placenta MAD-698-R-SB12]|uniref:Ricin B lectin domain-containing protein n=1 Tax=Postia placenta MAD-698-R-SB12 TaxID=670580 RepID=A0A1X6MM07_9APHY|nr:hypothetical protein POSPLADRAFT_1061997 [Postia placenta MAD-698-R-SB12]OSX57309.1 hypothetical protein POSPLADRAFT_1061997 [Postia placenta MAD-698-R-SB12]